ncbi:MAG: tRNA pseudouridine(55) synthase TruB [Alphaproteobacteria bacterium]|nr:tRNA pseudouridine(55) synthase TruB [Alphaproteobacteria bacterium]
MKNKINGWLVINKPYNMGSTNVVGKLKWLLKPEKIGHAGTLDPLATGVLPIALGHATKTIQFVMDGKKTYQFDVVWGAETTTDDKEGEVVFQSEKRPSRQEIEAILPQFHGMVLQTPPIYSALKINGKRAYDLARNGEAVEMKPRTIQIDSLKILTHTPEKTRFEVVCGKGTYVRSIGHDLGRILGCYGHISFLHRTKCGPFDIKYSILLENLEKDVYNTLNSNLISTLTALDDILVLAVSETEMKELMFGKAIRVPQGTEAVFKDVSQQSDTDLIIGLKYQNQLVALAKYEKGFFKPFRVFAEK